MSTRPPADFVDSAAVLRVYRYVVATAGVFVVAWGPVWTPAAPGDFEPFLLTRVFGAIMVGAALCAIGLERTEDPISRHRALLWFLLGHVVVAVMLTLQEIVILVVVGVAANGEELLARVGEWNPDVVLQDLLMPGGLDGVRTTEHLMTRRPESRVVALTASVDEARMMGVLRAGAAAYVRKDADPETLVAAVRAVAAGKTFIDPAVSRMLSERTAPDDLTQRELDVLREVALGHTNREIAVTLGVTDETVKTHVARVLGKLQVENRAHAIVQALKRGLVTLEEIS